MNIPSIPAAHLRAILHRKPERLPGRMTREIAAEPGVGGSFGFAALVLASILLGFILATGGRF